SGMLGRSPAWSKRGPAPPGRPFDPAAIRSRCHREIPTETYYRGVERLGLQYGAAFRGIQQLWQGQGTALGRICLPPGEVNGPYGLHPAFLDACLHVYPAALGEFGDPAHAVTQDTYLPVGVERFRVYRPGATEGWAHAVVREPRAPGQPPLVDIEIYGSDLAKIATIASLSLRRLPREALAATNGHAPGPGALYHLRWDEQLPAPAPRAALASWLVFADRGGV